MKRLAITHICETLYDEWEMNQAIHHGGTLVRMPKEQYWFVKIKEANQLKHNFRMRDDDGNTYFYGKCADYGTSLPLDFYGKAFGCTEIQFINSNGEWETL